MVVTLFSCDVGGKDEAKKLIGAWVLNDMDMGFENDMSTEAKELMDMMDMLRGNMTFTFLENGNMLMNTKMGETNVEDKATYVTGWGTVTITDLDGTQKFKYSITNSTLTLSGEENGLEQSMIFIKTDQGEGQ